MSLILNVLLLQKKVLQDSIWFGNYWQNTDSNKDKYVTTADNKDPIKWRVLDIDDSGNALLLSDKILDTSEYHTTNDAPTTWKESTLRSALNCYNGTYNSNSVDYSSTGFLNNAFSIEEQNDILNTVVENDNNPVFGTDGGENTNDKVFCLSINEVMNPKYGFVKNVFTNRLGRTENHLTDNDPTRMAQETRYTNGYCYGWVLRTPGRVFEHIEGDNCTVSTVLVEGAVDASGPDINSENIGIRPVIRINLALSSHWEYAGTVCSDGTCDENPSDERETDNCIEVDESEDFDDTGDNYNRVVLEFGENDIPFEFKWSPSILLNSKPKARKDLAELCLILSSKAYGDTSLIDDALVGLDLVEDDIETLKDFPNNTNFRWHRRYGEATAPAHTFALKKYTIDGEKYNLITIIIRGSNSISDWLNNLSPNGFINATIEIYQDLQEFLEFHGLSIADRKNRYLITGHSLGGATANLLQNLILSTNPISEKDRIYSEYITCYTYGSPFTIFDYNRKASGIGYSMNFVNPADIVTKTNNEFKQYKEIVNTVLNVINPSSLLANMIIDIGDLLSRGKPLEYMPMRYGFDMDMGNISVGVNNLYKLYSGNDLFEFTDHINRLQNPADVAIEDVELIKMLHSCEMYMALISDSIRNNSFNNVFGKASSNSGHILSVYCPVDVNIIDNSIGEVVASINNNVVTLDKDNNVQLMVVGDSKFVQLLDGRDYTINFQGSNDGTMDYMIQGIRSDDRGIYLATTKKYENVELYKGKIMQCVVKGDGDDSRIRLLVVDENGKPMKEILENGIETDYFEEEILIEDQNDSDTSGRQSQSRYYDNDEDYCNYSSEDLANNYLNALLCVFFANGQQQTSVVFGKQEQGPLGKIAFTYGTPKGWREAFSFNMIVSGKTDYTNKKGVLCMYIPSEYLKYGRNFAITGLDERGNVHVFNDLDDNFATITCSIDLKGYAYELVYK